MNTTLKDSPVLDTSFTAAQAAPLVKIGGADLTPDQLDLIKKTVAKGATDDELALFAHVCNRTGLDPFARQIYAIKRKTKISDSGEYEEKLVFQVAIDGFRLIAERTKNYLGQTTPLFYDQAGNEREVWLDSAPPKACKVGIYRKGAPEPIYAVALWSEFVQQAYGKPTKMWAEKSTLMLAKCAEALALRKGFPQELSGLYVHEEMASQDEVNELPKLPAVTKSRPHIEAAGQARVDEFGDITLSFGRLNGRKLSSLSYTELSASFLDPWKDPIRKATAQQRLGVGFMQAVYAAADGLYATRMEELVARRNAKESLSPAEVDELAAWEVVNA